MKELIPYSQKSKEWGELLIVKGLKFSTYGCAITACGIIAGFKPDETLSYLKEAKAIDELGRVIWDVAAKALNCEWNGFSLKKPKYVCIGVTNYYKKTFPTHFYVDLGNGMIIDPLLGEKVKNKYLEKNIGYRLFTNKEITNA